MRLIELRIENFGKLQDFEYRFAPGLNVIAENNGWGKSTLVSFIRVMFYGFENDRSRDEIINERRRFKPWQGGIYGGSLTFETQGKRYIVKRVFGDKAQEDEFLLLDADTLLESDDYSSNLGEELFKIDREAYKRTVMITQSDVETHANDSINAKLGNLTDNTDDINNYEIAVAQLKDILNAMSPTRKTGSLSRLKDQLTALQLDVKSGEILGAGIKTQEAEREALKVQRQQLSGERLELQSTLDRMGEIILVKNRKETYKNLKDVYEDRLIQVREAERVFTGRIPSEEEMDEMLGVVRELDSYSVTLDEVRLSPEERRNLEEYRQHFGANRPEAEDMADAKELLEEQKKLRELYRALIMGEEDKNALEAAEQVYGGLDLTDRDFREMIDNTEKIRELQGAVSSDLNEIEMLVHEQQLKDSQRFSGKQGSINLALLILGAIGIVAAVALRFIFPQDDSMFMPIMAVGALGAFLVIVGICRLIKSGKRRKKERVDENAAIENLQSKVANEEESIQTIQEQLQVFLQNMGEKYDPGTCIQVLGQLQLGFWEYRRLVEISERPGKSDVPPRLKIIEDRLEQFKRIFCPWADYMSLEVLYQMDKEIRELDRMSERDKRFKVVREKMEALETALSRFFNEIGVEQSEDVPMQLSNLKSRLVMLKNCKEELFKAEVALKNFEEASDIEKIETYEIPSIAGTPEELREELRLIEKKLEELTDSINDKTLQINSLCEQKDSLADAREHLADTQESFERDMQKYNDIEKTKALLDKAKNSMTAKYVRPVMEAFRKYAYYLSGNETENVIMNSKVELKVMEAGMPRSVELMSTGIRDLFGVAQRMALVDVMYEEERPTLIFDDPFVNLDTGKITRALEFTDKLAEKDQIIYLTCNRTRTWRKI